MKGKQNNKSYSVYRVGYLLCTLSIPSEKLSPRLYRVLTMNTIYTNPVSSVTVWKETKDDFKQVALPYVIAASFAGKNLLTVELLPFTKTGKKVADPYFALVIDWNYNVSIKLNNIANSKGYVNKMGNTIINLSETIVNHWLKQPSIVNNGNVFYTEVYLLAYAILPLLETSIDGNLGKKLNYAIRINKLSEYSVFHAFNNIVSVCPLTQAILTECRDHHKTLTVPIIEPKPEITQDTIDQHQTLADNKPEVNPTSRVDNTATNNDSLPPIESFDQGVSLTDNELIKSTYSAMSKNELIDLAKVKGLTVPKQATIDQLVEMLTNNELTVTV